MQSEFVSLSVKTLTDIYLRKNDILERFNFISKAQRTNNGAQF